MDQEERLALIRGGLPEKDRAATVALARQQMASQAARQAPKPPQPRSERQQLLDAGFVFSVDDQDQADSAAEHRARRRLAEQETTQRDHVHAKLRDLYGPDYADEYLQ